ncbi:glycosyltransferase family 9 protein [Cryptosporangium phraense]|uniref:Glycosyltransferase family 9 protein n=1 Tax=Cryptosporangium phraense TaxID=2593070 RepID=A0A545AX77_9ACTN|nr:glycosyltransferase family 9 protein [Cryptosporangium phraense]TQS45937.1 glycosyltransferase family 9 protein [Cryptosporangium phraense]
MTARVLVLRALGLGDLLTAVPALRGLRRALPDAEIVLAAPDRFAAVALASGAVDRVLPTTAPGRSVPPVLPWDGPAPDVAVDLHGNGLPSRQVLRALSPGAVLGWALPGFDGPMWREDEHERVRWCRMLEWYGVECDPLDLRIGEPAGNGPVVLHPGADAGSRRWPPDRFAAVARELARAHVPVVITAGRGERALAESVAADAGLPADAVLGGTGDLGFSDLVRLIGAARAVVVGDTGIAHLATALGTPSVVLFGPVSPALWGPPPDVRHRILWRPDDPSDLRPGDAHGAAPDARLLRVQKEDVLTELENLGVLAGAVR